MQIYEELKARGLIAQVTDEEEIRELVNNGKAIGDCMDLSTADRLMIQVPMFHCFGMVLSMTSCMTHGATLCPMPYFSAKVSLACINQERITCFNGVPTMFIAMFNHPDYLSLIHI